MHTKSNKTPAEKFIFWPKHIGYVLIIWAIVQTVLFQYFNLKWIALPWFPVACIGLLSLLVFSLKNIQIQRRKTHTDLLWKTIVRSSSTWATFLQNNFPHNTTISQELKNKHQAWLVVLHYQLNQKQELSDANSSSKIQEELAQLLTSAEIDRILQQKNSAKQLIALQSQRIKELYDQEIISNTQYLNLLGHLADYYDLQLRCEKANNYSENTLLAKTSLFLVRLFILLLPIGLINEFQKMKPDYVLLTIPLCMLLSLFFIYTEQQAQKASKSLELEPK